MSRLACAVIGTFGRESEAAAVGSPWDFSPDAEKFPKQLLVVDDEPLIRWSVSQSLASLGFDVSEASDAASALKMVTTSPLPFRIVVLDLRLPDPSDVR